MTKNLLLTTALLLILFTSATAQDQQQPQEAALSANQTTGKIVLPKNAILRQNPINPEALLYDLNGRVKLDMGSEPEDAVLLSLSGQVNLSPTMSLLMQNPHDVAFVTSDPFDCSTSKLYYNRTNRKLWGNSNVANGCALVSGSGTSGPTGGGDALVANPLSQFAATTSAQLAGVMTDETGSSAGGQLVFSNSPTLITPAIASFANATHNHINGVGGGQLTDAALSAPVGIAKGGTGGTTAAEARTNLALVIGSDVQAFNANLATIAGLTPTSNNFIGSTSGAWASITPTTATARLNVFVGDTGSGGTKGLVPAPAAGDATRFLRGDGTFVSITGGGDALTTSPLSQFATTTSAQLAGVISNETGGAGVLVFNDTPTIITPTIVSFVNAGHNHANALGGGQITDAALSAPVSILKGGTGQATQTAGFDALDPLTTKGDIIAHNGTNSIRLAVGGNTLCLRANSAQAAGLEWGNCGDVTGPASATDNAVVRFDLTTGKLLQNSAVTIADTTGDIVTPGTITTGTGGSEAGQVILTEGTAPALIADSFMIYAPTDVAAGGLAYITPAAASTGFMLATNAAGVMTISHVASTGSGSVALIAGSLNVTSGKTAAFSNTLTFTGTDSSSVAFGAGGTVAYTIASGTSALGTSAISSGACATVVTTTATGTATTDTIGWGFNGDPTGVTGYAPTANGMLTIIGYPSANAVNWKVCNNTSASVTPGAITLNWRVGR